MGKHNREETRAAEATGKKDRIGIFGKKKNPAFKGNPFTKGKTKREAAAARERQLGGSTGRLKPAKSRAKLAKKAGTKKAGGVKKGTKAKGAKKKVAKPKTRTGLFGRKKSPAFKGNPFKPSKRR